MAACQIQSNATNGLNAPDHLCHPFTQLITCGGNSASFTLPGPKASHCLLMQSVQGGDAAPTAGEVRLLLGGLWVITYRSPEEHSRLSRGELAYIHADPAEPVREISWRRLLPHRQTWAFAAAKFMTDPIWWFYLFWIPSFLHSQHGLALTQLSGPLVVIYLMADAGSIGGGWLSSRLLKRGWSVNRGRKTAMALCALAVVPIMSVPRVAHLWPAVLLIGLAASAHQGWSCNLFTLASDMFPKRALASVVGLGGFAGAVGGMLIADAVGYLLHWTHSYIVPFMIAGTAYLAALLVLHLLAPRLAVVCLDSKTEP